MKRHEAVKKRLGMYKPEDPRKVAISCRAFIIRLRQIEDSCWSQFVTEERDLAYLKQAEEELCQEKSPDAA